MTVTDFYRFYNRPGQAARHLKDAMTEAHGKLNVAAKEQVATLSFLEKLVRGKLPGRASDWNKIINEESFFAHLMRGSMVVPAGHPLIEDFFKEYYTAGKAPAIKNAKDLQTYLNGGSEFEGLLIENHYFGIIWYPEFTTGQKVILLGIEFVKIAAAIAAAVATVGAASGAVVVAVNDAAATINSLVNAAKAVGQAGGSLYGVVDAGLNAKTQKERLASGDKATPVELLREQVNLNSGSMFSGDARQATGVNLGVLNLSHIDSSMALHNTPIIGQDQANKDRILLDRMYFMVVQRILPIRSSVKKATMQPFDDFNGTTLNRYGYKYTAGLEYFREGLLRVGPCRAEIVAAAPGAYRNLSTPQDYRTLMLPFSALGVKDGGAFTQRYVIADDRGVGDMWTGYATESLTPQLGFKQGSWTSTSESYDVEASLPIEAINQFNKGMAFARGALSAAQMARGQRVNAHVQSFPQKIQSRIAEKRMVLQGEVSGRAQLEQEMHASLHGLNVAHFQLNEAAARDRIAREMTVMQAQMQKDFQFQAEQILIAQAQQRRIMAASKFESETSEIKGVFFKEEKRHSLLTWTLNELQFLEGVQSNNYKSRMLHLLKAKGYLDTYQAQLDVRSRAKQSQADIAAQEVLACIRQEIDAINACPAYVAHVDDSFDVI